VRSTQTKEAAGRVQLMPLPRLQTTRRPHFTSRRSWRTARLMLRASSAGAAVACS